MTNTRRIWAPSAKTIEIQIGERRFPMGRDADGWWSAEAPPGDYGFIVDGEGPFPDPRSGWQPNGVHALSRPVDHSEFAWTDARWDAPPLASAVIYELHVGTFTPDGTFEAVIEKLDHLVSLGVTHVELMPVNEFDGARGWGYDGVAIFSPHNAYGGPEGLKRLVDACHRRGLAVIQDVVYNHFGPSGNYTGKFGPYATKRYASLWGDAMNFDDAECAQVRRFFCDNALMWLRDYHFDGLRLDAVHAIIDTSAVPFLEQLACEVKKLETQLGRRLVLIAESDLNDPRLLWERGRGGFGLHAQWSDDFHHALHTVLTGEKQGYYGDFGSLADLAKAVRSVFVYDGNYSAYRRRPHGRPPAGLPGGRFVVCAQNHDQAGNRAQGDRSSQLMSLGRLKIAAAMVLTSPCVPMLFQGEEWGAATPFLYFTNFEDHALGRAVGEGRRREFAAFGWKAEEIPDPQAHETFERSRIDWSELSRGEHAGLLAWHRRLIQLRRADPSWSDGRLDLVEIEHSESERWFLMDRGTLVTAFNLADAPRAICLHPGQHRILLASAPLEEPEGVLVLPPESVAVMSRERQA